MKVDDEKSFYISVLCLTLLVLMTVLVQERDESETCARDMVYYLTPYQRQSLLNKPNPTFKDLCAFCKEEELQFSDIISARDNKPRFYTR